ncbi:MULTISPECIES: recombinase RecT [Bacillota]|jgi:recombination protein RecT|uniref:Recombinase RecT n=2 Tax=Erysipelotrichaceae TaxID=128827 RepID=A0A7G9GLS0_9FIRM|nr:MULTISPECIES: recombinase RecT [Bacillota]QNM11752.1 recombinase RecT [[Eubacterium] hominis]RGB56030.1 recombinase [Absiella sp. AM22-9]RGB61791.1 recombinase [Absiella sp. AM10-20]RGB70388.1 recombinase [Absiella sp. AM09-45]RGB78680.1 recombinase [Absiella sp. AM09-50]
MAVNNSLSKQPTKQKFSVVLQSDAIQKLINNTLGDQRKAQKFITAISSAVATNPALQECDSFSIINAALLGETLRLSPSPQLGHYYMVPFNDKKKGKVATFELGYKGYIQLAIRSGQYKTINVIDVKEGELKHYDRLSETIELDFIDDEDIREETPTIGYCAMFETINGYRKTIYWTYKKMLLHADKYSMAFSKDKYEALKAGKIPQSDMWKYSSFWYKDFDGMAFKTMLRQLISKWAPMSIESVELETALANDMAYKDKNGDVSYVEEDTAVNYANVVDDIEVTETHEQKVDDQEPQQDLL